MAKKQITVTFVFHIILSKNLIDGHNATPEAHAYKPLIFTINT